MDTAEFVVWSAMLGSLLTLAAGAFVNVLLIRNANALRMLLFVLVAGTSSLTRTGLVETFFPALPEDWLRLLKVCAAPLSAALVIKYMGLLLGGAAGDPLVQRVAVWGAAAMLAAALVLGALVFVVPPEQSYRLLRASAIITATAAVVGLGAALRVAAQGDPLARWAAVAAGCLIVSVFGLFLRSMDVPGIGLGTWIVTAICTVAYFLLGSVVAILRIRETRQLDRLARLESGADPATGLPTGAVLLTEVEHAFWRTARQHGVCTVVCLHVANLYALSESAGPDVEQQILTTMAARIRRAAGFRCVVGLYHPLCFVVVISADKRRQYVGLTVSRLRSLAMQALPVEGADGTRHSFRPHLGVGVVTPSDLAQVRPMEVINSAERLALEDAAPELDDELQTRPGERQADTASAELS